MAEPGAPGLDAAEGDALYDLNRLTEANEAYTRALARDPHDEAAIGAACAALVSEPELHRRLSKAALRNVQRYSWSAYAGRSASLYAALRTGGFRSPMAAAEADRQGRGIRPDRLTDPAPEPPRRWTAA